MRTLPEKIGRNRISNDYLLKTAKMIGANHKLDLPKKGS